MKKNILIVVLLIGTIFLTSCDVNYKDLTKVEYKNVNELSTPKISKEEDFLKLIVDVINNSEKQKEVDENIKHDYVITLYKDNKSMNYYFDFMVDNKTIFFKDDSDNWFRVNDDNSRKLFLDKKFNELYFNNHPPKVTLLINDEKVKTNDSYDWNYKKTDNEFHNSNAYYSQENKIIKLSNKDKIGLSFEKNPDKININVYKDNELVNKLNAIEDILNYIDKDGQYSFEIEIIWNKEEDKNFYGTRTLSFTSNIDKKANVKIMSKNNFPGNILMVYVDNINDDETIKISSDIIKSNADLFTYKEGFIGFIPIDIWLKTGTYNLSGIFNEGTDEEYVSKIKFEVENKDFVTQYLTISEEISNATRNEEAYTEFRKNAKSARFETTKEKLWDGEFIVPLEGVLTTDFGEIRYVNNEVSSSRHSGLDIAAPRGTEIVATNSGKVVLAKELILTGNTIIIDHGLGIFSSYYHLNSMKISEDDMVNKKQIIGTVGSTGFSTGPHLHFSMSLNNTYVNTHQFLEDNFIIE